MFVLGFLRALLLLQRPTAGGQRLGRWANGEGGGMVSVWVSGLGGTYLERGRVEGGQDASHSGWTAAMVP